MVHLWVHKIFVPTVQVLAAQGDRRWGGGKPCWSRWELYIRRYLAATALAATQEGLPLMTVELRLPGRGHMPVLARTLTTGPEFSAPRGASAIAKPPVFYTVYKDFPGAGTSQHLGVLR